MTASNEDSLDLTVLLICSEKKPVYMYRCFPFPILLWLIKKKTWTWIELHSFGYHDFYLMYKRNQKGFNEKEWRKLVLLKKNNCKINHLYCSPDYPASSSANGCMVVFVFIEYSFFEGTFRAVSLCAAKG